MTEHAGTGPTRTAPTGTAPGSGSTGSDPTPTAGTGRTGTAAATTDTDTDRVRTSRPPRLRPTTSPGRPRRRFAQVTRALGLPVLLAAAVTAAAPGAFTWVRSGDTLSHIAERHGVSVSELQRINGLGNSDRIYAGQQLRVSGSGRSSSGQSGSGGGNGHRIAPGETLSTIAARYGVTQRALADANGLNRHSVIYAGRTLAVPGRSAGSGSSDRAARSRPSSGGVSGAEVRHIIRATAQEYGVDPALALAIAHQESGFRQGVVSHANAIGVMQVLPSTARWMERVVGRPLDPYDVRDNITTGVALLAVLRSQASVEDTIAAYYQGLRAVRERGWYAETRPYVANVLALKNRRYD